MSERVGEFVSKHWHGLLIGGGILLVVMMISGMIGSCYDDEDPYENEILNDSDDSADDSEEDV